MPRALCALFGLVAAVVCLAPRPATAFENQWHAGGGLGAVRFSESTVSLGPAIHLEAAYGLSDMFDLKVNAALSQHRLQVTGDPAVDARFVRPVLSLAYKLDVLEWVPYMGVDAGYMWVVGAEDFAGDVPQSSPALGGHVGLDYAPYRSFGIGIVFRTHWLWAANVVSDGFLRAEYRWGL